MVLEWVVWIRIICVAEGRCCACWMMGEGGAGGDRLLKIVSATAGLSGRPDAEEGPSGHDRHTVTVINYPPWFMIIRGHPGLCARATTTWPLTLVRAQVVQFW